MGTEELSKTEVDEIVNIYSDDEQYILEISSKEAEYKKFISPEEPKTLLFGGCDNQ